MLPHIGQPPLSDLGTELKYLFGITFVQVILIDGFLLRHELLKSIATCWSSFRGPPLHVLLGTKKVVSWMGLII